MSRNRPVSTRPTRYRPWQADQAGATRNPHGIIPLSEPAQELLRAWEWWHKQDFPSSAYWFPGRNAQEPLSQGALTKRLARVCDDLNIPHVSAHGGRAFFAKTLRQDELDDRIVAARLGHSNVAMVEKIYGGRMHERDPKLSWLPSEGPPAWHEWLPIKLAIHLPIMMR